MAKFRLLTVALIASVTVVACTPAQQQEAADAMMEGEAMMKKDADTAMMMEEKGPRPDPLAETVDEAMVGEMMAMSDSDYEIRGDLLDVTEGSTIRGTAYSGNSSGVAQALQAGGKYKLMVTFENLPDPVGDDFYEGWVVRKEPFDVISTGQVAKVDGKYINVYTSSQDLIDHAFYVLTLEPNDGDPAPADHIVEGTMTTIEN